MLKTFSLGGIHPEENKLSSDCEIEVLPLSPVVKVPISQHIGAPAQALVKKGDIVKTGQVIAKSSGFVSANIHSPVSGTVEKLEEVVDSSGYRRTAIIIKSEGDEWEEGIDRSPEIKREISAGKEEIIKRIAEAGIVGLGGATFPSHV
ncbi:MAG TPA: electron transporter RnfC, partial [Marinilabiliaceae bacterium]|nr:electron transporter RnfC [Marinilabiliaceae bacterium]